MRGDQLGGVIRWKMHIPVTPEAVFRALNTDQGRAAFWAEAAVQTGEIIEFEFINGYRYRSKVIEKQPPNVYSIEYIGGLVRFELSSDGGGGTDLMLTHSGVNPNEWNEVHAGWLNVLFPLKAWLTHGVDLRNHDPERTWDHGYADQ